MHEVYKVVANKLSGDFTSMRAMGLAEVTYKIGEFVEAPDWLAKQGYHLCVFDTEKNAKDMNMSFPIFLAVAEDRVSLPPLLMSDFLEMGEMEPFSDIKWPTGTLMFKRVKLIRRVR